MNECLVIRGRDEIGKHRGLKIPWPRALWVRVPPPVLSFDFLSNFCYNYYMKRRYKKMIRKRLGAVF